MSYKRYAIYYAPPIGGPLAAFGNAWLGWDISTASPVSRPKTNGFDLSCIAQNAQKYGFHGTMKAPFFLTPTQDQAALELAFLAFCHDHKPIETGPLELRLIGRFLALCPSGDQAALGPLASACVMELDAFRAPLGADELARKRKAGLSERQDALLQKWGYAYILDQFKFHLTLSNALDDEQIEPVTKAAEAELGAIINTPFQVNELVLCAQREDGFFEEIKRAPLTG